MVLGLVLIAIHFPPTADFVHFCHLWVCLLGVYLLPYIVLSLLPYQKRMIKFSEWVSWVIVVLVGTLIVHVEYWKIYNVGKGK